MKADLRHANFAQLPRRGKGSHTEWKHALVPDALTVSGHDGDDAHHYQERQVRDFIARARAAEQATSETKGKER